MAHNIIDNRIRMLTEDDRITDLTTAKFPNGDFVLVIEQKVGGLYYLCVTKYNSNMKPLIPSFYVKNAEGVSSTPSDINADTANLFASSPLPMNPSVTVLQNGEFVIAFFQMPYWSITLKQFATDGYAKNLYASNDALGQYPLGDPQNWDINNPPDDRHWEENVPRSLSLLSFDDNRFVVAWATNFWPLPCRPIGLPTNRLECEKGDAPYKASISISTYNSDGTLFQKQVTVSRTQNQDENVNFYTSTALRMLDPTSNFFIIAYYLQQALIAKSCHYDPNTVLQYDALYFDKPVLISKPFVQIGLYNFGNTLPIFFYESRNRVYNNIQSIMDVKLTNRYVKSTLIGDDNTQGQYNDRDPNKCVLPNGMIMVTWHRYHAKDDTSLGLFVQYYTFSVTPTDLIVNRLSAPQCFDNTEHSLGSFIGSNNQVSCIVENGSPYFFGLDPTQGAIYYPGQCNPLKRSAPLGTAIGNKSINYTYAVATLMLALFIVTVLSRFIFLHSRRLFPYQTLPDSDTSKELELSKVDRTNLIRPFGLFSNQNGENENYQSNPVQLGAPSINSA